MRTLVLLFFSIFSGLSFAAATSSASLDSQFIPRTYRKTPALKPKPTLSPAVLKAVVKVQPLKKKKVFIKRLPPHRHLTYATLYPGSLRSNISRIAKQYGWHQVIWKLPEDYRWLGKARISGNGLPDIFKKLLASYPVQADFYQGNHVLVIVPRTL